jgi:PRTRC genetic system protein C
MALKVTELTRTFIVNGMEIADPNPALSITRVQELLSAQYPELANAKATTKTKENGVIHTTFTTAVGTKG